MPLKSTIATKIFGLAVTLVFLMIVLAGFLLWEVSHLNRQLKIIAKYYQPLERCIVDLNEAGLRRRLAFERWFGELDGALARPEVVVEARKSYAFYHQKIEAEFLCTTDLLKAAPEVTEGSDRLSHVASELKEVRTTYEIITTRQQEVLKLMEEHHHERAGAILNVLDDMQNILQDQRNSMQGGIESIISAAIEDAEERHTKVLWTTVAATLTSVLLGLSVAALVTRRLVHPVRSLMLGIQSVEKGDLTISLPIASTDEVGALTHSFNFFVGELRAKEELRSTFGKYIDPRILERVLLEQGGAEIAGDRQKMSVAFTDLVGFTGIGEHLTPSGVVNLLNRHFTLQAEGIQKHHGVIDKFIGDAVMAFWGPPFTLEGEHPSLACRAALEQIKALHLLEKELPELLRLRKNLPPLDIRIGISTGEVIVGNIGSENTRSFTVIGDNVNLASRLENANRFYGTHILICDTTHAEAGESIITREIDLITVKGKTEPTRIFELLGLPGEVEENTLELRRHFIDALAAYRQQAWDRAEAGFRECLRVRPEDGPANTFLERISSLRLTPPEKNWNGVWQMTSK
ncbi:MAG: adenylate/guanylate cyclase domain-containing protein [Chthoniobacterales bacterium]